MQTFSAFHRTIGVKLPQKIWVKTKETNLKKKRKPEGGQRKREIGDIMRGKDR